MSIHPDIHRAILAHGGNLDDAIRDTWMASIPPQFRKAGTGAASASKKFHGGHAYSVKARASRDAATPRVLKLYAEGQGVKAIGRMVGFAATTVRVIIRENGTIRPTGRQMTRESRLAEVSELAAKGMSAAKIGQALGMGERTVRYLARDHGIQIHRAAPKAPVPASVIEGRIARFRDLVSQGYSTTAAADAIGCCRKTAWRWIKNMEASA